MLNVHTNVCEVPLGTGSHGDGANAGLELGALAHRVAAWIFD